jgi:spore germination protein
VIFLKRNFLILTLAVALVAVGFWGIKTNRILAQWELQAENQYKNAFQELNIHLNSLEEEMSTALVTKSNERRIVKLNNIWRNAFAAQEDLGELPIAGVSLVEFKKLLSRLERYTYQLSQDNVTNNLSSQDWDNLNKLHNQVKTARVDMEEIHNEMEQKNFKWSKHRNIILEKEDESNNSFSSSFATIEKRLKSNKVDLALNEELINNFILQVGKTKEKKIENEEAIDIAKDFLGTRSKEFNFRLANEDEQVNSKNIITVVAEGNNRIVFDVSRSEGDVIWFLETKSLGEAELEREEIKKFARDFVKQIDYSKLSITEVDTARNIGEVNFVSEVEGVLIYPQQLKVKVALDNGDIIGFNARRFLANKDIDIDLEPKLTLEEAKEKVNKRLDLKGNKLVVIRNDRGEEILSYEFIGQFKKNRYKIYINADNGREEKVVKSS